MNLDRQWLAGEQQLEQQGRDWRIFIGALKPQLSDGITYLQDGYWWLIYPVGACIVLTVMALNFIGDALRDALDVRLRRR